MAKASLVHYAYPTQSKTSSLTKFFQQLLDLAQLDSFKLRTQKINNLLSYSEKATDEPEDNNYESSLKAATVKMMRGYLHTHNKSKPDYSAGTIKIATSNILEQVIFSNINLFYNLYPNSTIKLVTTDNQIDLSKADVDAHLITT